MGVVFLFETGEVGFSGFDQVIDCTGIARADDDLRGMRGEMLILHTRDVSLGAIAEKPISRASRRSERGRGRDDRGGRER
ncbi:MULTISPECIES: hypothetical protein [unclassified Mesorhizobium]|uniref:hypothetical protein n=1 Tax=unclassified Mesorhizobium TaxID=325217 RepID=UPI0003CE3371|nr:hypothetical protein X759_26895 [Mesorhizobium sp. LSHC420B00]